MVAQRFETNAPEICKECDDAVMRSYSGLRFERVVPRREREHTDILDDQFGRVWGFKVIQ